MAYIVLRNDRFYGVAYDGVDPATGRERLPPAPTSADDVLSCCVTWPRLSRGSDERDESHASPSIEGQINDSHGARNSR